MTTDELALLLERAVNYSDEVKVEGCIRTSPDHFGQEFKVRTAGGGLLRVIVQDEEPDDDEC